MRWSELSDVDIAFLWAVAQEHFQNSDMAAQKDSVLKHARILWNKSRSFLYRYFVAKCNSTQEAIRNIPPMMDKEDWKWLVEKVFLSDKFQKKSQIGKTIRKNKKLKHYNGSRPVGEKIHNHIEQYGEEPSYHTILEYAYKKGETVQDAYAAEKIVSTLQENWLLVTENTVTKTIKPVTITFSDWVQPVTNLMVANAISDWVSSRSIHLIVTVNNPVTILTQ